MKFDFETKVNREGTGNMKGEIIKKIPEDAVMLYGAEMDFPTAPFVREAMKKTAENGLLGFIDPTPEYLESIIWWLRNARNYEAEPDWILGTNGTVSAFSTAMRAFTKPGDGIIIQAPSYFRHDRAMRRNGRRPVYNPIITDHGRIITDFDDLEKKMADPENTMMLLVNPQNPTSKVFREDELMRIAKLAEEYGVAVFSDEIFAEMVQPGFEFRPYSYFDPEGISCFSLGKCFSFTGVSQANVVIPDAQTREKFMVQRDCDHYGSIDPFFYSALRAAYSEEGLEWIRAVNEHTLKLHAIISDALKAMPEIKLLPLEGCYVAWIDFRGLGIDGPALQRFLEDAGIFADPGDEYGCYGEGFCRWNLGTQESTIRDALERLYKAYKKAGY